MSEIIYPTLDLFIYDLRNAIGDTPEEIRETRDKFKKKLPESIREAVFENDNRFEAEYIELLGSKKRVEDFPYTTDYEGYDYPVCINDAYGLLVDCSINEKYGAQPAECFARMKAEIEENRLRGERGTIGQTWMIYGYLPEGAEKEPAEIAKDCYTALMGKGRWKKELKGQGKFLGADIFELSKYRIVMKEEAKGDGAIQDIQENDHVIIIIYPDLKTVEESAEFLDEWMRLFLYRHKILWNYGMSRILKHELKREYSKIEAAESEIEKGLAKGREIDLLEQNVKHQRRSLSLYVKSLKTLDLLKMTVEINLRNYQNEYVDLERKGKEKKAEEDTDLDLLKIFIIDRFKEKYWQQIVKDKINMWTGLKLLQEVIKATESSVAVEKVKRDKNFQELVTNIGVGWAVGSFVAEKQPKPKMEYELSLANMISVETLQYHITILILPVCVAIAGALLFGQGRRLLGRWGRRSGGRSERSEVLSRLYDHMGEAAGKGKD